VETLVRRGLTAGLGQAPSPPVLDTALAAFHRCYAGNLFTASKLYPGVHETLTVLRGHGIALGCITNKPKAYTGTLLERAGIDTLLDFAFSADTFDRKKPDPTPLLRAAERFGVAPSEAVMIGDSRNDREAARAAGFDFIYAAYGYARADDPGLNQGNATIGSFGELAELLSG
jgi:phosphoglycolate phosphatase